MDNCRVIAITNQKGGVGKTTTTVNLGIGLARQGKKVLMIDADPQGSLSICLGQKNPDALDDTLSTVLKAVVEDKYLPLGKGILQHPEGADFLPANIELSGTETGLVNIMSREYVLKEYIGRVKENYDYILIDCMPSLGMMTINAFVAADSLIVPCQPSFLSTKGLNLLFGSVARVRRTINPKLRIDGILLTMPYEEIASKSSEYFQMAGACRFYNTDRMVRAFIDRHEKCNIVNVGCGLETAYFRINPASEKAVFYEMDLPEVIAARRKVLGESENEILIPGDMFDFAWAEDIDKNLPTLVTVIGVFQYFAEEKVIGFLKRLKEVFPGVEVIFDAMTGKAIKYANDYIKKTGNNDAELHFSADNGKSVAEKCGMKLLEERPFFGAARKQLKRKLKLYTRIAMKVVDEGGRRGFLTHLKG